MTEKEKAKAYDKVRKKIAIRFGSNVADEFFAEFEESEGKKIRKEIVNYFQCQSEEEPTRKEVHDKWIAWLEKQADKDKLIKELGEYKVKYTQEVLENHINSMSNKDNERLKKTTIAFLKDFAEQGYENAVECIDWLEKQGEQKPEENKGNIGVISSNSALSEENEPQKKLVESYLAKFDKKFSILPTLKGKQLADYKNFLNKCQQIFGLKYWGIHPTQAKLFEKLSLLWAAWGAEHLQGLGQTGGDMDNEISMWSEEDEENMKKILNAIGSYYYLTTDDDVLCNWLKTLKNRVQPQPNQEWSEDDKAFLDDILCKLEHDLILNKDEKDWLKSLRPQNRWKPSDEQMGLLQAIINEPNNAASESCQIILKDILEQLRKLKEE